MDMVVVVTCEGCEGASCSRRQLSCDEETRVPVLLWHLVRAMSPKSRGAVCSVARCTHYCSRVVCRSCCLARVQQLTTASSRSRSRSRTFPRDSCLAQPPSLLHTRWTRRPASLCSPHMCSQRLCHQHNVYALPFQAVDKRLDFAPGRVGLHRQAPPTPSSVRTAIVWATSIKISLPKATVLQRLPALPPLLPSPSRLLTLVSSRAPASLLPPPRTPLSLCSPVGCLWSSVMTPCCP
ncbi:hypothetical protein BJ546DRAFT_239490 [Cryomyces antarcticus]